MMADENSSRASIHIRVWGCVQGVGFRAYVAQKASLLGINGNVEHDQVETHAEGNREALETFLVEVKKGPSASNVTEDKVEWGVFRGEFKRFRVRWF